MTYVLLAFLAMVALGLFLAGRPYVGAWFYKNFSDPDPYPPEAAEAPKSLDEHFKTAPRETDPLVEDFDWHAAEYMLRKTS